MYIFRNLQDRETQRNSEPDPLDGQMLWVLWRHIRLRYYDIMIDSTFLFNFTITWVQTRGEKAAWGSSCTWGGRGEGWDIWRSLSSCSYYPGGERGGKRRGGRWQRWGGGAQGQDVHTIIELGHSGCFSSQEPFLILSPMHNSCQLAALGVFKYLITPRKSFKKTVSTFNLKLNRKPQLGLERVE